MYAVGAILLNLKTDWEKYPDGRKATAVREMLTATITDVQLRSLIHRLMDVNPKTRPSCQEVLQDEWITGARGPTA